MTYTRWLLLTMVVLCKFPDVFGKRVIKLSVTPTEIINLPQNSVESIVIHASSRNTNLRYIYVESLNVEIAKVSGGGRYRIYPEKCEALLSVQVNGTNGTLSRSNVTQPRLPSFKTVGKKYFCFNATFPILAVSLGKTSLILYVGRSLSEKPDTISNIIQDDYKVTVVRTPDHVSTILHWCLIAMVILTVFCISCKVDLSDIVQVIKKPKRPCVSFAMMFIFKPLFSFGLGTVFTMDRTLRMGVFALGCCPEGAISLIWTHILGGHLGLAILISCGEAILSFGAIPLSMISLGRIILGYDAVIPFQDIAINSAEVLSACTAGLLVRQFAPETLSMKLGRFARVQGTFTLMALLFVNIYSNRDLFSLMGQWQVLACGTLLPGLGGLFGGVVAWACCHEWKCVKSIALAIILQGIDVPLAIMMSTLTLPDAQLAGTVPVIAALFANAALWPPCILRYMKNSCGATQEDVIVHTTNTTMSMKKKKFKEMFFMEEVGRIGTTRF